MLSFTYNNKKTTVYKSAVVLFAVALSIITMPLFEGTDAERVFVTLLLSVVCIAEIYNDVKVVFFYRTQLFFGSLSIFFAWLTRINYLPDTLVFTEYVLFAIFFLVATISTIYKVTTCIKLNNDTIFNAINGYLFLGFFGASMASVLELLAENAFMFSSSISVFHEFEKFIYSSFVTLTTVGYGDITPASSGAKVLTIFLCVAGQLYLTVLVGLIIGKYISNSNFKNNS